MPEQLTNIACSTNRKTPWYRSPKTLRHGVMAVFFLFLMQVAYDHLVKGGGPRGAPSVEAYCPFGGLESLYQFLTTGGYVHRIEPSSMVLLAALLLLTLIASRGFCGWVCPFGSIQEWMGALSKRFLKRRFNPTGAWDRALRNLKYVLLAVIISLTWRLGTLVFREYDPFLAFFHLGRRMDELPWAYALLAVVLAGSVFIERFFCKYACPLGAVLGVLGKAGLTRIERDPAGCKGCNLCQKTCHAHVDFLSTTVIRDSECNHCLDCVVDCPKPNVLAVRGPKWRLSHAAYASLLVAGLMALVGASKLAGEWRTTAAVVASTGQPAKASAEEIRGWMTLDEVSVATGVPREYILGKLGLAPETDAGVPLRDWMHQQGKSVHDFRDVVAAYQAGAR